MFLRLNHIRHHKQVIPSPKSIYVSSKSVGSQHKKFFTSGAKDSPLSNTKTKLTTKRLRVWLSGVYFPARTRAWV
jgi:hypothetical protein